MQCISILPRAIQKLRLDITSHSSMHVTRTPTYILVSSPEGGAGDETTYIYIVHALYLIITRVHSTYA